MSMHEVEVVIKGGEPGYAPGDCSVLNAELLDHIKGMRLYYSGPFHQPSPRCVCHGCIDEKIHKWSQSQNAALPVAGEREKRHD